MYRVDRNNFYKNEKKSTIYTPVNTSNFLFSILEKHINKSGLVFDPCVGKGSLLSPFKKAGYRVLGVDVEDQGFEDTIVMDYLMMEKGFLETPSLVLMNPPFNIEDKTRAFIKEKYGSRPLLPEIWLMKTLELFEKDVPIVMFTPYGFRLNQSFKSKRWQNFINHVYPEIKAIISLPKDLFDGILFHSEILIFNINGLKGHYFCNAH